MAIFLPNTMSGKLRVAFLGGGMMAQAMIPGVVAAGLAQADDIIVFDPNTQCQQKVTALGTRLAASNAEVRLLAV